MLFLQHASSTPRNRASAKLPPAQGSPLQVRARALPYQPGLRRAFFEYQIMSRHANLLGLDFKEQTLPHSHARYVCAHEEEDKASECVNIRSKEKNRGGSIVKRRRHVIERGVVDEGLGAVTLVVLHHDAVAICPPVIPRAMIDKLGAIAEEAVIQLNNDTALSISNPIVPITFVDKLCAFAEKAIAELDDDIALGVGPPASPLTFIDKLGAIAKKFFAATDNDITLVVGLPITPATFVDEAGAVAEEFIVVTSNKTITPRNKTIKLPTIHECAVEFLQQLLRYHCFLCHVNLLT